MKKSWSLEGARKYQRTERGRAVRLAISARSNARKGGLECDIDANWVQERLRLGCAQTGVAFDLDACRGSGFHRTGDLSPSLDRIDHRRGYTKDNVQVVTWIYNRAKLQSTDADVLAFARALVKMHGGDHL